MNYELDKSAFIIGIATIIWLLPTISYAENPIGTTFCSVVDWFHSGSVGVGLAALSLFIVAIAALMNKITWGMAIFSMLDVCLIFGAADLVVSLGGVSCYE